MIHLRICLIGHYNVKHHDEGVRNIASHIAEELLKKHEVMKLDIRNVWNLKSWKEVKSFRPDIIHYILSPTKSGLIAAKALSFAYRRAKTVISAPNPYPFSSKKLMSLFKPSLILVQSYESETLFQNLGCKTQFLPTGVDVENFVPVTQSTKLELKRKYGVEESMFVILHVGSIKKERNVLLLRKMQLEGNQVLIVGKQSESTEKELHYNLKEEGILVWKKFFGNIEEVYALSDCYVFPTIDRKCCAEIPLSVLEAMSCNLPVISTKFRGLPWIFRGGDGLFFADKEVEFVLILERLKNSSVVVKTREKVLPYSWENITKKLEGIYNELLSNA